MTSVVREAHTFTFDGTENGHGTPVVNGFPVSSATAVTVRMGAQQLPEVVLTLVPLDGLRLLLAGAQVSVADETREALLSLGWTPPEEAA